MVDQLVNKAAEYRPLFSPLSMLSLAIDLLYVLKACRDSGILAASRPLAILHASIRDNRSELSAALQPA